MILRNGRNETVDLGPRTDWMLERPWDEVRTERRRERNRTPAYRAKTAERLRRMRERRAAKRPV